MDKILGITTVDTRIVKISEVASGTVNTARDWLIEETIPGV